LPPYPDTRMTITSTSSWQSSITACPNH